MRDLLTPPEHRGPLIAAGAVLLTIGVALEQVRLTPGAGVQFAIAAALAAGLLWLALQGPMEEREPPGWMSVLIVAGLGALYGALLLLADWLGDPFASSFPSWTVFWTALLQTGVAGFVAARRRSAIALLVAAIAASAALLSLWDAVFDTSSPTPYRWLLLLLVIGFAVASLGQRGRHPRAAEQLVNAAGLALLGIAAASYVSYVRALFSGDAPVPLFWEIVLLGGGLGLVAYAAADRTPGAAYLGVLNLAAFVAYTSVSVEETLTWWPLLLLVLGGVMLAAGLRPRRPLPPAPGSSTRPGDQPLAARADGDT